MKRWYWGHRGMEPWDLGHYVLRQDMIDALAANANNEGDFEELLERLGVGSEEWHEALDREDPEPADDLAAVDGGREDT